SRRAAASGAPTPGRERSPDPVRIRRPERSPARDGDGHGPTIVLGMAPDSARRCSRGPGPRTSAPERSRRRVEPHPGRTGSRLRASVMRKICPLLLLCVASRLHAVEYPEPTSADHLIRDFRFASGEALPELRIHYRTLGTPRRGEDGKVSNAVLIL